MTDRYAIIGDIIANTHDNTTIPGGALAIAIALRELGGMVSLRTVLADDEAGRGFRALLRDVRIHPGLIDRAQGSTTALVHRDADGNIVSRTSGVGIEKGAVIDIYALFGHDALILDTRDQPLRRFLTDLPAHTDGNVKMLSTLSHLDWNPPTSDDLDIVLRCDAIIGTSRQLAALTGEATAADALGELFDRMPGSHLRAAIAVTENGIDLVSRDERVIRPVEGEASPDFLLPQAAAGIAWGMAHHAPWEIAASIAADPSQHSG